VASVIPAGVTQISNTASIADDGASGADPTPGDNSASDTTPVTAAPDLTLTVTDNGMSVVSGGMVTYVVSYANQGSRDATGVVITETIPAHTTFDAAASTAGWSCMPDIQAGSVCTLAIGTLAAGASGEARFVVTADNPLLVDELITSATISDDGANGADPTPGNNSDTSTTPVAEMRIFLPVVKK
jgi:large repetitive protein